jgi:hypothetical protein
MTLRLVCIFSLKMQRLSPLNGTMEWSWNLKPFPKVGEVWTPVEFGVDDKSHVIITKVADHVEFRWNYWTVRTTISSFSVFWDRFNPPKCNRITISLSVEQANHCINALGAASKSELAKGIIEAIQYQLKALK